MIKDETHIYITHFKNLEHFQHRVDV